MRLRMSTYSLFIFFLLAICGTNCGGNKEQQKDIKNENHQQKEQCRQGKNESGRIRTDSLVSSISNSKYHERDILGIWAIDPNGPHADFEINKDYYFVVDQEGDANMLYAIYEDSIIVFFKDFTTRGQIIKARNDTLIINWDNQETTTYTRWKE